MNQLLRTGVGLRNGVAEEDGWTGSPCGSGTMGTVGIPLGVVPDWTASAGWSVPKLDADGVAGQRGGIGVPDIPIGPGPVPGIGAGAGRGRGSSSMAGVGVPRDGGAMFDRLP